MTRHHALRAILAVTASLAGEGPMLAQRTITADVVALDQAFYNNRLGAFQAGGMIFALLLGGACNSTSFRILRILLASRISTCGPVSNMRPRSQQ